MFASGLNSGTVASLDYANTMKDFAYQVGTIAIATMMFPVISKLWAEGDIIGFKNRKMRNLSVFSVLYIPIVIGIIYLGDMAIRIVFQRGAFTSEASVITTNAFILYSINLIPMAYRLVFHKAFFAMQKTKYVLAVSFLNVLLNIVLNMVLVKELGYLGLAIATTAASIICMPFNFWIYSRTVGEIEYKPFLLTIFKCLTAAAGMLGVIVLVRKGLALIMTSGMMAEILSFCIITIVGVVVYFVICNLLRVNEINDILTVFKRIKR
jgi:putative peptidoglycan lipid II flippase